MTNETLTTKDTMPPREAEADPFAGEWKCGLTDRTEDGCPYPFPDCGLCGWLLVDGKADPLSPAAPSRKGEGR